MSVIRMPLRVAIAAAAAVALAVATVVAATSTTAGAVSGTATTAAEFESLVIAANGSSDLGHEIRIGADFTWDGAPVVYTGDGDLDIVGQGHTITLGDDSTGFLKAGQTGVTSVTIQSLTIDGGDAVPEYALWILATWTQLSDVTIQNVTALESPVIFETSSTVFIYSSTFSGNSSTTSQPGAVDIITGGTAQIIESEFMENFSEGSAGAVRIAAAVPEPSWIYYSQFSGNDSYANGGAVYVVTGSVSAVASEFIENQAGHSGGAIYVADGYSAVYDSYFADNVADDGGALWTGAYFEVTRSTFWYNGADDWGGAIYSDGDDDSFVWSSSFFDNAADRGGAIAVADDDVSIVGSTFTGNVGRIEGAHAYADYESIFTRGSVFADSSGSDGCIANDGVVSAGYNFDDEGTCTELYAEDTDFGEGDDPELGPVADNGGRTLTREPALTSPLLDYIDPATCASLYGSDPTQEDQRGVIRALSADNDGGCDVGAVELVRSVTFTVEGLEGPVEFTVTGAYTVLEWCEAVVPLADGPSGAPAGIAFPHGLITFCVGAIPGSTVTVTATFPSPVTHAFKVEDEWLSIPGAAVAGNTVTYEVTDGGELDADGDPDGVVQDPLAAGVGALFTG